MTMAHLSADFDPDGLRPNGSSPDLLATYPRTASKVELPGPGVGSQVSKTEEMG